MFLDGGEMSGTSKRTWRGASKVRIGQSMRSQWGCLGEKRAFNAHAMGVSEARIGQSMRARWVTFARESPDERTMSIATSLYFNYKI